MGALRLVLGDQLSDGLSALSDIREGDVILMAEVAEEATYVRHHKQKIVLVLAAMRAFAERLRTSGHTVRYVALDDADNSGSIAGEVRRAVKDLRADRLIRTRCGEWRLEESLNALADTLDVPVEAREDDRFICSADRFRAWASDRRQLRMEYFYREMRRETGLLMDGDQPEGGQWNYDAENRKKLPADQTLPRRKRFPPDASTKEVMALVGDRFADHFGDLDGFDWPVTREQAGAALDHFIDDILPGFGDWQDAMANGEAFLWHSLVSTSLNLGLLGPLDICQRAEQAFRNGSAPLNAVEGFIRQILGWREFVRGVYWLKVPEYRKRNALDADRSLPWFYWSGETDMACVADVVAQARTHAYAHHIQRLMVTGNLAMLLGVHPDEVDDWYMVVFADAYEWVEMPNTRGMATYADGGIVGSKPYAASGAYIDRMSDYCAGCAYDVKEKTGDKACPFNRLYWGFLERNRKVLRDNPRLAMPYRTLDKWPEERRAALVEEADACRKSLGATVRA